MIDPVRARRLVIGHCPAPVACTVPLAEATGCVLAENLVTPIDMPPFDNSAMDGFALRSRDTLEATPAQPVRLALDGVAFAGNTSRRRLRSGHARGIMTGAPVPAGADTVLPRELAALDGDELVVSTPLPAGRHVRRRAEEARRGAALVVPGTPVVPGVVAVAATAGRARLRVYRKPRVAIVATGNETVPPGGRLRHGQIYDSNSAMVAAMVRHGGYEVARLRRVRDHRGALRSALSAALRCGDVIVVTGGVSVGDRDYLREVLEALRVTEVFWRVRQKPGKPLYFGRRSGRLVFGLPGNPASVFTCFYLYVYPALRRMSGAGEELPLRVRRVLDAAVTRDPLRWRFLKAVSPSGANTVSALPAQGSHMTSSLARTNAFIEVPPGDGEIAAGASVTVYSLFPADG
jgi:molybdopterin molybdotransferase